MSGGYMLCLGTCVACKAVIQFNPDKVPSLVVNGQREPLCKSCHARWNEIHKQNKQIDPDAYEPTKVGG